MIRPDGNVTAVSQALPPIAPKRLEIIRELMPDAKTVAFLDNPVEQAYPAESESIVLSEAAEALGIRIEVLQARNNDEMEKLFGAWTGQQGNALIVTPHPFYISVRPHLIELANSHAIPTIYPFYEDAAGGLMSYGNSNFDIYRQMAACTARILDGERPGDLPIIQPVKYH
jgi:putative ABC transport system substrate-binding protein